MPQLRTYPSTRSPPTPRCISCCLDRPVPMGNFYSNVLAGPTAGAPTITVLTGILAILILATNVKDNCALLPCVRAIACMPV